jgi:starvation-inducible DNA-binding protein
MNVQTAKALRTAPLQTPTDLKAEGVRDISGALNILLADVFALYLKTKNFHWHVSGPHFRDYHLLLDEHGGSDFRHDGRDRRAGAQDRRHDLTIHW